MKQCTNVTGYKKDLHNYNIYFLINQHKYSITANYYHINVIINQCIITQHLYPKYVIVDTLIM